MFELCIKPFFETGEKMVQPQIFADAQRCLARTRSGKACQSPAVKGNKRCRMHGGKGSGAPKANRNARKHGARSAETRKTMALVRQMARMLDDVEEWSG